MSNQVTHFDASWGFETRTACGRSTHLYVVNRPKNLTKNTREVTCISCQKKMPQK